MTLRELEEALIVASVTIYSRDGQVRYLAPAGAMTPDLREAARSQRDLMVRLAHAADAALDKALEDECQRSIIRSPQVPLAGTTSVDSRVAT
jgi:hypothetical protein